MDHPRSSCLFGLVWLISRIFSANKQYFSLTSNQPTILSVMAYQPNKPKRTWRLSPILFNIVADILAIILNRVKQEGLIRGIIPHLIDDGLSILQYADDIVIFLDHDIDLAKNMKFLLCGFEQLSV